MKRRSLCLALATSLLVGSTGPMALTSEEEGATQGTREALSFLMISFAD